MPTCRLTWRPEFAGSPAPEGIWYVYLSRGNNSGNFFPLTANDIYVFHESDPAGEPSGDSKPVLKNQKRGWYHPGTTLSNNKKLRCIGAFLVVAEPKIELFTTTPTWFILSRFFSPLSHTQYANTSFVAHQVAVPPFAPRVQLSVKGRPFLADTNRRMNGLQIKLDPADSHFREIFSFDTQAGGAGGVIKNNISHTVHQVVPVNGNGEYYYAVASAAAGNELNFAVRHFGWELGPWMGDVPSFNK